MITALHSLACQLYLFQQQLELDQAWQREVQVLVTVNTFNKIPLNMTYNTSTSDVLIYAQPRRAVLVLETHNR